jgi:hypothetical protein
MATDVISIGVQQIQVKHPHRFLHNSFTDEFKLVENEKKTTSGEIFLVLSAQH